MPEHILCRFRVRCIELALQCHKEHGDATSSPEAIITTATQFHSFVLSQEKTVSRGGADTVVA